MTYLVDADILGGPARPDPDPAVVDWLRRDERKLAIDPIILGELRLGILLLPAGPRRTRLERWLDEGLRRIRCLPWDPNTGLRWARLLAELRTSGRAMPIKDSLLVASALVHSLTLVTRNRNDFEPAGVQVLDPFSPGAGM